MDLPDELILAVGTFILHPPDILNFTRTCRRLYGLTNPLLYENITLDYEYYSTSLHYTFSKRQLGRAQPYLAIKSLGALLSQEKKEKTPRLRSAIRSLKLRVPSNLELACLGLWDLLVNLTSLTELRFESLERDDSIFILPDCTRFNTEGHDWEADHPISYGKTMPASAYELFLCPVKDTLKTLTVFADRLGYQPETGYLMGNFRCLKALEYLDI